MKLENNTDSFTAQDLAGKAILFEIGAKAGILELIEAQPKITVNYLSKELHIKEDFLKTYLEVLKSLKLLDSNENNNSDNMFYFKTSNYEVEKNKAGYISWGMISCAPLIENTQAFTSDFDVAVRQHLRSGEHVARTSKWMGEKDFYPHAEDIIVKLQPKKVVDLGSGTCGLLINLAQKIDGLKGIGIDISKDACNKAKSRLQQLNLENDIEVVVSPIQKLIENQNVFLNADVIHAGFVFHDLLPDEESILDKLLAYINKKAPKATLIIVDAIPFSENNHEKAFSSAFTFLHKFYMGRKLLPETAWQTKLEQAGFDRIQTLPLGISGGRIFIAQNKSRVVVNSLG